jgi:hypothetical protein
MLYLTFSLFNPGYGVIACFIILGSEINALIEHYSPHGKRTGEKKERLNKYKGFFGRYIYRVGIWNFRTNDILRLS